MQNNTNKAKYPDTYNISNLLPTEQTFYSSTLINQIRSANRYVQNMYNLCWKGKEKRKRHPSPHPKKAPQEKTKTKLQKEEQVLKQSIFATLARFLSSHVLYIINHWKCSGYFMPLYNRMIAQIPDFPWPCDLECKSSHSYWYQNVEFSHVYHHTMFERNQFTHFWTQDNAKHSLYKITRGEFSPWISITWTKFSMRLNYPISHRSIPISSKVTKKSARKWMQNFLLSLTTVTLHVNEGYSNWYQTIQFNGICHHTKLEINRSVNIWAQTHVKVSLM